MTTATEKLWAKQNQHEGDREHLFTSVADHVGPGRVLYPGSFVDLGASFAFDSFSGVAAGSQPRSGNVAAQAKFGDVRALHAS